jgi:MFS family permease
MVGGQAEMLSSNASISGDSVVAPAPAGEAMRTKWGTALLIAVVLLSASALRLVLTPLQDAAAADLHFTDIQMSVAQGVAKGLPIAMFAIPIGLMIDHWNRARLLLLLGLCWTGGTIWTAFVHDFNSLFMARALVGLGSGSAAAVAISMIADLSSPEKRGRVLLTGFIGVWLGVALSFAGAGALFGHFKLPDTAIVTGFAPWRQAVLCFGVAGILVLIPLALLHEPVRHEREQKSNAVMPALRALWSRRVFLIPLFVGSMAAGVGEGAAGVWAAPVLQRNFGIGPDKFGAIMGVMIMISGLVGSALGGVVADIGTKSRRRGGILIGAIVATFVSTAASVYPLMPSVLSFNVVLGVLLLACTVAQLVGSTAATVLLPNEERGMCMALIGILGTLIGLGAAPLTAMFGMQVFGDEHHLGQSLAIIGVGTGVIALIGYLIAMRNAPDRLPTQPVIEG